MEIIVNAKNRKLNRLYDKIFKIIENDGSLFEVVFEDEFRSSDGYHLIFNNVLPLHILDKISQIQDVSIIQ